MNFFKSLFSDESETRSHNNPEQEHPDPKSPRTQPNPNPASNTGGWMFDDLIKTLSTRSESVIETYRCDLQEFGLGLKKEIEVAQGSLEMVGHAIEEFGNTVLQGTAQIITGDELDSSNAKDQSFSSQQSLNSKRYSRFDAQVRAIQGDSSTDCEEPEDLDDYGKWQSRFDLEEKGEEIERLLEEDIVMEGIYNMSKVSMPFGGSPTPNPTPPNSMSPSASPPLCMISLTRSKAADQSHGSDCGRRFVF